MPARRVQILLVVRGVTLGHEFTRRKVGLPTHLWTNRVQKYLLNSPTLAVFSMIEYEVL